MQTRREDLRAALMWAAASYIPFAAAAHAATRSDVDAIMRAMGLEGGPWALAMCASFATGYFLLVDALLPIGRSKVDLARGVMRRVRRSMTSDDAWGARIFIGFASAAAMQVFSNLLIHN